MPLPKSGSRRKHRCRNVAEKRQRFGCTTPTPVPCESHDVTCIPVTNYKYPDLPITRCKEEVVSLIESSSVVIVHGATGSGKSTQLPQYILDYYTQRSTYCNIVVTQPRKIGASSIARWISRERSWALGGFVGYQVGLEKVATKDTRLIYMTTGVLLQKIVGAKSLAEFTHIFIDEVILMSATINCKEFADYFVVPIRNKLNPAYVFEVEGKPYAIEEYYLNDLRHISHIRLSPQIFDEPMIAKEMYEVAISLIQLFDELEMKESGENKNLGLVSERGSVLVFLPGLAEMNYMHELLTSMIHKRLQVYLLHSSVTLEEQNNVFLTPVPGYRKIILSTNMAESSVTVPDVKYGRAGRVSKGYCYRLVHKDFWTNYIPENAIPEMLRCPLGSTVLKVKLLDMGEPRALLATALSPPSIGDIERTILQLKEMGALAISALPEEENPYDGELTFLGRVLAQLPVDQQLGKLIVLGHVFGCLEECLIIAAALSLKNFFAMPFRQHLDGYRNKMNFSGNSKSDCIALVDAFKEELDWGRSNYIQIKRIRELKNIPPYGFLYYKQLQSLFRQCGQVKSIAYDGTKVNVDFQKQTVEPMQTSFGALEQSQTIASLPLSICVTEVVEVGHFWGYRTDEKNMIVLKRLTTEINHLDLMPLPVCPYPDLVCLAQFTDFESKRYYRAQILCVSGDSAEVFFVDYGNRSRVFLNHLKEIPNYLRELPFQALEFKMCKMRPSAKSLVCGEQWSYGASQRFASLVNDCALIVKVYSVVHSVLRVDVYRYSGIKEVNIRDVLIEEGYAELAEESYESKQSNELKELYSKQVENEENAYVTPKKTKKEEKHLIEMLLNHFSANKFGAPNCKATLHGPFNPYELKCHSMTQISRFRVDKSGRSFTGVLCGLGWNQSLGTPLLPEHDMELAFDVQFGVDDIVEINILRTAINKLVCDGPNGPRYFGQERIAQLQENAREKLLGLICKSKPRQVIASKWYGKPYDWNQVDSKLIIDQSERENERGKNTFLYQLHKLVVLNT
ncbi:Putative ATP-dependent RNA helicase TDRD9 [Chelonia mydas]|uniref:RNA helicase n=1 Tax=Chelonia mydas TaxID=8469 RepID=M7BXT0_CHEMY|nr:Putative ATP-dependent RNA helicase TDRD9 [Chelonia mydas]